MPARSEDILAAVAELERVLRASAGGPDEAARVDRALAGLEDVIGRHIGTLRHPDDLVGATDRPRVPSPGVDRETGHLREELENLLRDVRALRARVPAPGTAVAPAEHAGLVGRTRQLAEALKRYEEREARLILDAVETDLGAGD